MKKFANAVLFVTLLFLTGSTPIKKSVEGKNENRSPEEPYDFFFLQRTFPNKTFDVKAFKKGISQAKQLDAHVKSGTGVSWTLEGPGNIGARFNCLAVCPSNSNIMYAGASNGGLWKTSDDGNTWAPVTDSLQYLSIGAVAINPFNVNEIWIGTGDVNISGNVFTGNGLFKSTDGGQTWSYLGLANTYIVSSIKFNPQNTNQVMIGTMGNPFNKDSNRGMYKTTDGGSTFYNCLYLNDSTGIIDMVQDNSSPQILYASTYTRLRTDWYTLTTGTEVYIYKSTDFGTTWYQLSGGLPNGLSHERLGIAICQNYPYILYALYSTSDGSTYPDLYQSTNAGQTWQQIVIYSFSINSYGNFGWYFGKIFVDPNDPNTIYMPGVDLQYSNDGGANWAMLTPPWYYYQVHADGHWISFNSSFDFIYCTDGGLYRTTDGGATWYDIENIPNNEFYSITEDPNNPGVYAGGVQDNGTMFGNSSTINNFIRITGGDGFTVQYTPNPNLIYSESQYGDILYSDMGIYGNWTPVTKDIAQNYNWHTPYFVSPLNYSTLFLGGNTVQRIDGAPYGSYTDISPVLNDTTSSSLVANISTICQSVLDSNILYAGTSDGFAWSSLDYGASWNNITPFQGSHYYITRVFASPNNASNVYITRSGYRMNDSTPLVFKSSDFGSTWTGITGNLPTLAVNDIEVYPGNENILFIANDAGVYFTTDGGISWSRLGNNLPFVPVLDIQLNYNSTKLIAGTFGRSMYTIDIQSIVSSIKNPAAVDEGLKIYPNPVHDIVYVKYAGKINSLIIYSIDGKFIMTSKKNYADISMMKSGIYYMEINTANQRILRKMIKE